MSNSVTTTIAVVGQDRASETIRKVKKALEETGEAAGGAADKTNDIAEKSGDLERGVKGFKDILGQVGGGPLADIADKFGGIEALLKGFGPAVGPWALGLAAVGAAAAYIYQQTEETRKANIDARIAALEAMKADAAALADRYGVSRELLGLNRDLATVQEAQAAASKRLADIAQLEIEAEKAKKENREHALSNLQMQIADAKRMLDLDKDHIAEQQKRVSQRDAATAKDLQASATRLLEERRIGGIMDANTRIAQQSALVTEQIAAAQAKIARNQDEAGNWYAMSASAAKDLLATVQQLAGLEDKQKALAAEVDAAQAQRRAKAQAAHQAELARIKEAADARKTAKVDVLQAEIDTEADPEIKAALTRRRIVVEAETAMAEARRKFARDRETLDVVLTGIAAKRVASEVAVANAERQRMAVDAQANLQAQQEAMAKLRAAAIEGAEDPQVKFKLQLMDLEKTKLREIEQVKAQSGLNERTRILQISAIEASASNRKMALIKAESDRRDTERAKELAGIMQVGSAVINALEQEGASRRLIAGLKAGMEAAAAYAAYPNVPEMISHGIAAALYAKAALTSTPTAGGGTSAAAATPEQVSGTAMSGAQTGGGGTVNVVLSRGFIVGTPAQVGKAVNGALGSLKGTGFGGKGV